jgi:hypothetical protein
MDTYVQGFMAKCAETGVDPEELVKQAARGSQLLKLFANTKPEQAARISKLLSSSKSSPDLLYGGKSQLDTPKYLSALLNRPEHNRLFGPVASPRPQRGLGQFDADALAGYVRAIRSGQMKGF